MSTRVCRHLFLAFCLAFLAIPALAAPKKVVLIAGPITGHPKEAHEYEKSVVLLRQLLETSPSLHGQIRAEVLRLGAAGLVVAGYGAPAKASTLLAWCGLGPDEVKWIADRNPLKQGRTTPGTGIPIVDPQLIESERPDVLILFAWNFAEEIMSQLAGYRQAGGRFLIPVPAVRLV